MVGVQSPGPQYLLRFDDLCPQMDGAKWRRFLPMLERYDVKPILAVVPDNRDRELAGNALGSRLVEEEFWEQMRQQAGRGATIGLHGYQHLCAARGKSLMPLHGESEFAGVEERLQKGWIEAGIQILRRERLNPAIWVAPRHGFDRITLRVLSGAGIDVISDGFAMVPFRWMGVTWLPQQIWSPVVKKVGLWTICLHPATVTDREISALCEFLELYSNQFTSVDRVLKEWAIGERSMADRAFHERMVLRIRISRLLPRTKAELAVP